jgi:hypothetical protein
MTSTTNIEIKNQERQPSPNVHKETNIPPMTAGLNSRAIVNMQDCYNRSKSKQEGRIKIKAFMNHSQTKFSAVDHSAAANTRSSNHSRNNLLSRDGKIQKEVRGKSLQDFSYKTVFKNNNYHIVGKVKGKTDLEIHPNASFDAFAGHSFT